MVEAPSWVVEALDVAERYALKRSGVDWPAVRAQVLAEAEGRIAERRAQTVLAPMFIALDDDHSFLVHDDDHTADAASGEIAVPSGTVVDGCRVLSLPGVWAPHFSPDTDHPYLDAGFGALDVLDVPGPLLLDVRSNGGGNCYAMFMVLAPLLGVGRLVGWDYGDRVEWVNYDGAAVISESGQRYATPSLTHTADRVAVLCGPDTGSSGEAVVVAAAGRTQTRLFGRPTAGMTTANDAFHLSDGWTLYLAVARMVGADGCCHDGPIVPDERVDGADVVARAEQWLGGRSA